MRAFRRMIVESDHQTATLLEEDNILKIYKISTAKNGLGCELESFCTPMGRLKVAKKIGEGEPMGRVFKARIASEEVWTSDEENPLFHSKEDLVLSRILWLEGNEPQNANTWTRFIYLHGTNQETLLGTPASHGCIRFSNADILEVFDFLSEGDIVEILERRVS